MTRLERARAVLRRDDGFSLPEVIVAVMVNAACMTIIAASLVTFSVVQQQVAFRTANTNDTAVIEAEWRKSAQSATAIHTTSSAEVTFTRPSVRGDSCAQVTFALSPAGDTSELTVTRELFEGPADQTTGECTGTPGAPLTLAHSDDAGAAATFTYTTTAGRPTTFSRGEQTLDSATPRPAGVTEAAWQTADTGSATIDFTIGSLTGTTGAARVTQVLPAFPSAIEAGTTTRFVTP
jgi:Tfp pilus assembly protein PilV